MRVLALDLGAKRIGVAISDPTGTIAGTLTVLVRRSRARDLAAIAELLQREGAERIVVGLPISLNGTMGPQARAALRFSEELAKGFQVPVETWDERFSTVEAQRILQAQGVKAKDQRRRIDATAAAVILQEYLDTQPKDRRDLPEDG